MRVEALTKTSIIVRGDTNTHKERVKVLKGLWNRKQKGWVFPKKREAQVREALKDLLEAKVPDTTGSVNTPTSSVAEALDTRLRDSHMHGALRSMATQAGWSQRGGELLRDENHQVTGRTTWVPKEAWYAELPERLNTEATIEAVRKAIAGERLGAKERRVVGYMLDEIDRSRQEGALSPEERRLEEEAERERQEERSAIMAEADLALDDLPDQDIDALIARGEARLLTDDEQARFFESETPESDRRAEEANASRKVEGSAAPGVQARAGKEPPILESYTGADLAERKQAKLDAEQREAEETAALKQKREADQAREGFALSGSDREADELAARGQQSLPGKAAPKSKDAPKHEDVGEHIGGSRKDLWRERGLRLSDLDGMSGGEEAQYVTKEGVWPAIDYGKLIEAGTEPKAAALIKIIRDRLAARPEKDTPMGRRHYVEMLGHVREVLEKAKTVENVQKVGREVFDRVGWDGTTARSREQQDEIRTKTYSVYKTRKNPLQVSWADKAKADKMVAAGWPETKVRASRFVIREDAAGTFRVLDKTTYRTAAEGLSRAEAEAWIAAQYVVRDKEILPERPHLDALQRTGEDRRGGRDVSGEDLLKDFGFRGVEHGLWAAQDERQKSLNLAYEALHDLAAVLGIPPKALSLNGTLGLAFGARGSGRFAAHYEPGKLVINLTKLRGAGTLAHEWGHSLDHYFGELGRPNAYQGKARGASGWMNRRVDRANLRPEMAKAFDRLMGAIFERDKTQAGAVREQELYVEKQQAAIDTQEKRIKKAQERVDDAKESGGQKRESARFVKESEEWLKGVRRHLESAQTQLAKLREEPMPEGGYGKVMSSFYKEGMKLSGKSGEKGYWTRPTELFARAFESYVFDSIGDKGNVSQYLVQGVEPERYAEGYKGNPSASPSRPRTAGCGIPTSESRPPRFPGTPSPRPASMPSKASRWRRSARPRAGSRGRTTSGALRSRTRHRGYATATT